MNTPPTRPPLQPGQFVRRGGDLGAVIGIVVGILLTSFERALVRWDPKNSTIEPMEALVEVVRLFG